MTSTFDEYYGDIVLYLWYLLCGISFIVSKSHSLSKVFHCNFLVTTRIVNSRRSCSTRDKARMALWDQLLVN
jgi:hypothetical protein